jgi:signal transduction histidine kinase
LSINIDRLDNDLGEKQKAQLLNDTKSIMKGLIAELRTISHLLHPPLLDEVGLSSALQWYVDGFRERSGIEADLHIDKDLHRLPSEVEIAAFRVVQECLTNVLRHSGASKAIVSLSVIDSHFRLEVRDNGKGFSSAQRGTGDFPLTVGVGLSGMRERVSLLGGRLNIESHPTGTSVTADFPVQIPAEKT